ncbi:hypothetical protein LCGC14_0273890 [marine sediment metagenome]|uniref:Uncharacterized protein n=2 Tax=root TaxID=1 RepID=A0A9C9NJJ4_9HYPH|nr:hypothetical protein [Aurantimonas coralicida]
MGGVKRATFACPYCGHVNVAAASSLNEGDKLARCDAEESGCDRQFVVRWNIAASARGVGITDELPKVMKEEG